MWNIDLKKNIEHSLRPLLQLTNNCTLVLTLAMLVENDKTYLAFVILFLN